MNQARINLLGLTREELAAFAESIGEPRYRGGQIFTWLYAKGAAEFQSMTDLGKAFRRRLEETATVGGLSMALQQRSPRDGTTKFLFRLSDGLRIESVLIPPSSAFRASPPSARDEEQKRLTLCVSTQVGCPLDCAFCATGTMGFHRNLTAGEIVDQILHVQRMIGRKLTNVVFMGMGEPLLNYSAVMHAAEIIVRGMGIAARHVTISTAGRADRIRQMGEENRKQKLAVSLHSAVDATRSLLMPINRKYNLRTLLSALEFYYARTKMRITYEVILFDGINDTPREVDQLVKFARRVPSKINVIPFHPIGFTSPAGTAASLTPSRRAEEIVEALRAQHLTVMVRSSAGEDIGAACGQLAVKIGEGRGAGPD